MRRLLLIAVAALLWVAPAQAFTKQTGARSMKDGTSIAYDLYEPDGAAPAGGWPGVVVLHGLGGSKDSMAAIAQVFVSHGYAALAYTARGHGTSTGSVELAGPSETSDEIAMGAFFRALPEVSNTNIGAWGISYGGGQTWNGLAKGIDYKAAEVVETWTDLYTALWPQDIAKSGIVLGFAKAVEARSPLITSNEDAAIHSTDPTGIKALVAPRSALTGIYNIKTPTYMFQGRVDYAFDVTQAVNGYARLNAAEAPLRRPVRPRAVDLPGTRLRVRDVAGCRVVRPLPPRRPERHRQVEARDDRRGEGLEAHLVRRAAQDEGCRRRLPRHRAAPHRPEVRAGARDVRRARSSRCRCRRSRNYPRLVATVFAGNRVITHGAIKPKRGLNTIRLANYVQYLPKGTRLTVVFGNSSGSADVAYLGFGEQGTITLGAAFLSLQTLTKPVSG